MHYEIAHLSSFLFYYSLQLFIVHFIYGVILHFCAGAGALKNGSVDAVILESFHVPNVYTFLALLVIIFF